MHPEPSFRVLFAHAIALPLNGFFSDFYQLVITALFSNALGKEILVFVVVHGVPHRQEPKRHLR